MPEDSLKINENMRLSPEQEAAIASLKAEREKGEPVTAARMKEIERQIDAAGISYYQMMENAGTNAYKRVRSLFAGRDELIIFIGKGNNGGDGLVAARLALLYGCRVYLVKAEGEPITTDAKTNYQLLLKLASELETDCRTLGGCGAADNGVCQNSNNASGKGGLHIVTPQQAAELPEATCPSSFVVIDAIYGTGFHGELRENGLKACDAINKLRLAGVPVVAFDIPSGVNGDSGQVSSGAVRADVTIAFHLKKPAHTMWDVSFYTGQLWTESIGI